MKPARMFAYIAGCLITSAGAVSAQENGGKEPPLTFQVSVVPDDPFHPMNEAGAKAAPLKVRRGQIVKLLIEGKLKPGYHTYALTSVTGRQEPGKLWKYSWTKTAGVMPLWPVTELPAAELVEEAKVTVAQHLSDFLWTHDVLVQADAKPGTLVVPISLAGTVCDEKQCRIMREDFKVPIEVSAEEALPTDKTISARLQQEIPEPKMTILQGEEPLHDTPIKNIRILSADGTLSTSAPPRIVEPPSTRPGADHGVIFSPLGGTAEGYQQSMDALAKQIQSASIAATAAAPDLWGFILAGIFWGAVSLVTPCVFPMIPITVSFFLKQSEKEHHRPVTMAVVYSGTIIIVLTLAAAFLLSVFRWLSVNPIMNYALGGLFVFFALSLFGMYDIELPSGLARFTSSREGQGGYVGTIFMALTFTIISFACVAPFLGGFGGTSAGTARPWWHNILGGLAFSVTFAAPFFFLALFPTLLRSMPKSGSWLNSVKVVMGFLELAAAFKFFRAAELVLTGSQPWLFTFDFVMGIYVALCFLCGLYLLGIYRLPHDTPEEHLGVPRLMFAGLFLTLGLYLLPALFKTNGGGDSQRPRGTIYAWVDSFLLPETSAGEHQPHTANLPAAVAAAREHRQRTGQAQRIFIDFTGVTCTNCSINETHVFTKPAIRKLFEPYAMVKLYTDTVPKHYYGAELRAELDRSAQRQEDDAYVNLKFQRQVFVNEQLPLYVVLEPQLDETVSVVGVYAEGRINDEAAFAEFLREPK
jgi:thiol:disulfide interchange protein DsbD